jgi:hypothetical protein
MYFSVQMKLNDVEGAYHCPLCNKPSVQDVVGCDNCVCVFAYHAAEPLLIIRFNINNV